MECQIKAAPEGLTEPAWVEQRWIRLAKRARLLALAGARLWVPPGRAASPAEVASRLNLRPGEEVRVKPLEEIRATLDSQGRFQGLAYVPAMDRYCRRTFAVRKRIDRFFDERTRKLLRCRDVVILEGSFCEPALSSPVDYGGCDRTCFLFWKEGWLERVQRR